MLFTGDLVRLAEISRDNLPAYKRWMRDYEVQHLLARIPTPITDEAEEAWFGSVAKGTGDYIFAIHTLDSDTLIGNCGLHNVDKKSRFAEFGIVIGEKDYWGRGYGTDAARVILRFAFNELNLHRVELDVYDFNPRAIRSYEKVGFVHEAIRRDALFRNGAYHDVHRMGILQHEWCALYDGQQSEI
jgi:RimJ/RimL family protein N-acetyltransferase